MHVPTAHTLTQNYHSIHYCGACSGLIFPINEVGTFDVYDAGKCCICVDNLLYGFPGV